MPKNKPKILSHRIDWAQFQDKYPESDFVHGLGYYRCVKPLSFLEDQYDMTIFGYIKHFVDPDDGREKLPEEWRIPHLVETHDLFFTKQVTNSVALAQFSGSCDYYKKPLIVDLDDDMFNLDPENPKWKNFQRGSDAWLSMEHFFRSATALTVSCDELIPVYSQYNKNIHVLKNYHDIKDWRKEREHRKDGRINIGWIGSATHEGDLDLILPVYQKLWQKYGKKIIFTFCGFWPSRLGEFLPEEAYETRLGVPDVFDYMGLIADLAFDIGTAPLNTTPFNIGKSHIKWMEYASYKIPCVASKWGPYEREIKHGDDGVLCGTSDEWYKALCYLIDDPALRDTIGTAAYNTVLKNHQWKDHAHEWADVFNRYLGKGFKQ